MLMAVAALTYLLLTAGYLALVWDARTASPVFWYPVALALMAAGIFLQIDFSHPSDGVHILATFLAAITFISTSAVMYYFLRVRSKIWKFSTRHVGGDNKFTFRFVIAMFVISTVITFLYYQSIGFNLLALILTSGIDGSYSLTRMSTYAGDTYFAAGYVNQFKNVLLPLSSGLIGYWLFKRNKTLFALFALLAIPLNLFAVLGTGQRTYLIFAACSLLFGFLLLFMGTRVRVLNAKSMTAVALVGALFVFMTGQYQASGGTVGDMIFLTFRRIFYAQQWAGLEAFRYIYDRPIVWFREWYDSMAGILPGNRGSTLANEIHGIMFGTLRGTAPPTVVGSAYHNGGLLGVVLFFATAGMAYTLLYARFLSGPKTAARCLAYGALFFYLTTYFVGSPKYLFDNGVITLLVFLMILRAGRTPASAWRTPLAAPRQPERVRIGVRRPH